MKACSKCLEQKERSSFRKNPRMALGADSWCKVCASAHVASVRQALTLKDKVTPANKLCGGCKQDLSAENFSVERGRGDGLSRICRACRAAKHLANFAKDPEAWRKKARAASSRRTENPSFVVHKRISARVREWLGTKRGGKRTFDLLGYSLDELREHLERQFTKGMSWANQSEWHIDHIVPLSSFAIAGPDDPALRRAWALTNLRPLWAEDNIRKGAKVEVLL